MYDELVKALRDNTHKIDCEFCDRDCCWPDSNLHIGKCIIIQAADAIEELSATVEGYESSTNMALVEKDGETVIEFRQKWIPVEERLPECDLGAEVGNIEWISCGMVHAGCFGRGGKYRGAYFRTWTDAGEGMDAKDADYWRAVTLPEPPNEE